MKKNNFLTISFFIKIYALTVSIFTVFRIVLLIVEIDRIDDSGFMIVLQSLLYGLRFDLVISSYILVIPFLVMSILSFLNTEGRILKQIVFYYIFMLFTIAFFVCAADIPYFAHFFSRFSIVAFEWLDSPAFIFSMIFQEPRYWLFSLLFIVVIILFYYFLRKIFSNYKNTSENTNLYLKIFVSILALLLIFISIRGRIDEKSPIRVGTAYFCNNPFLNQLGLNPNFTLVRSYLDSKDKNASQINLMDNKEAIRNVQQYLKIVDPVPSNPLARKITFDGERAKKYNVVIIIMESMSAAKMKRNGNKDNLTPFLDSISYKGIYFENCYTAGMHTYNGIFSTLFSFPAIYRQHPMKESMMKTYPGMAATLRNNGYSTIYFTTHDGQFDNVEGFLMHNHFEYVIEKHSYPSKEVKTTLGVPDDYMFEYSIPIINNLHNNGKPFLSVFLTASDHGPYYIPDYFKPKHKDIKKQIVEYADYSLKKFIEMARKQEWFDNTLFVFVADHGAFINSYYDISLEYFHTPLLLYAPQIITDWKTYSGISSQIDIFPTVMDMLKIPYINETMGMNLFKESRQYAMVNADNRYGVVGKEWLLVVDCDKADALHRYTFDDRFNYASEHPKIVESMKLYAESHLQAFQYIIKNVMK